MYTEYWYLLDSGSYFSNSNQPLLINFIVEPKRFEPFTKAVDSGFASCSYTHFNILLFSNELKLFVKFLPNILVTTDLILKNL